MSYDTTADGNFDANLVAGVTVFADQQSVRSLLFAKAGYNATGVDGGTCVGACDGVPSYAYSDPVDVVLLGLDICPE